MLKWELYTAYYRHAFVCTLLSRLVVKYNKLTLWVNNYKWLVVTQTSTTAKKYIDRVCVCVCVCVCVSVIWNIT